MSLPGPTLYRHRIYCLNEASWVYLWKDNDVLLTTCPNLSIHTVQPGSASILDEVSSGVVAINKEENIATNGHGRVDSLVLNAAAGATVTVDKTWPMDIAIYLVRLGVTADCLGCSVTTEAAPLTAVGTLTADAPAGSTVLNVTPSAAANAYPGYVVTLQQGATVEEVGQATAVDRVNNTITVTSPTVHAFAAAGPTVVRVTARAADQLLLSVEGYIGFGETRTQSVGFPKGRVLRFTMANPNAAPARLVVYITYNY